MQALGDASQLIPFLTQIPSPLKLAYIEFQPAAAAATQAGTFTITEGLVNNSTPLMPVTPTSKTSTNTPRELRHHQCRGQRHRSHQGVKTAMRNHFRNGDAFTLVEVMLALAIVSIGLIAILGLLPTGLRSARDAADNTISATVVQDSFSLLRNSPFHAAIICDTCKRAGL